MLILDAGNSRIKWGRWQAGAITAAGVCGRAEELPTAADLGVDAATGQHRAVAVSVAAPAVRAALTAAVSAGWGVDLEFLRAAPTYGKMRCAYAEPYRLGVDRWAALVGGYARHGLPLVVVDCGTAVTIDCVDNAGVHHGGLITPGLRTMRRSLHTGTAQLPEVDGPADGLLGVDTTAAIRNGTFHALVGAIDHIVDQVTADLSGRPPGRLITGGDAELLVGHLPQGYIHEPNLVLTGAALLAEMP